MRWGPSGWAACVALALASGRAGADDSLEDRVKAAFLFNFARFVTWPADKFSAPDAPLQLCLRERDPLAPTLRDTLAGKLVETHPLTVREVAPEASWQGCHVAWLDSAPPDAMLPVLHGLESQAVVSVHEAPVALPDGVIRLYLEDGKLRFEVNDSAAQRARLRLSSRLMALAAVVHVEAP